MNTQNTANIHYVAIDVSKATLQVQDDKKAFTVENNSIGHRKLLVHLKGCQKPLVVYEASGGYERELACLPWQVSHPAGNAQPGKGSRLCP
jgi:transposase